MPRGSGPWIARSPDGSRRSPAASVSDEKRSSPASAGSGMQSSGAAADDERRAVALRDHLDPLVDLERGVVELEPELRARRAHAACGAGAAGATASASDPPAAIGAPRSAA